LLYKIQCYLLFSPETKLFILHLSHILISDVYFCRVVIRHEGESHYLYYRTFWLNLFYMQKKNTLYISVPEELFFCHTFRRLKEVSLFI